MADIVARHTDTSLTKIDAGRVVLEIQRIAAERGFRITARIHMIAKALLNLEQVVYTLAPNLDPNKVIRNYASRSCSSACEGAGSGQLDDQLIDVEGFLENSRRALTKF